MKKYLLLLLLISANLYAFPIPKDHFTKSALTGHELLDALVPSMSLYNDKLSTEKVALMLQEAEPQKKAHILFFSVFACK